MVAGLDAIYEATRTDEGINLIVTNARAVLPQILETATRAGATVSAVEVVEPDLEAVFLHLTGRALRD
jgi:ABC-2 type transport system ATP-binding protein